MDLYTNTYSLRPINSLLKLEMSYSYFISSLTLLFPLNTQNKVAYNPMPPKKWVIFLGTEGLNLYTDPYDRGLSTTIQFNLYNNTPSIPR